jgi:hypothetical protein
MTTAAMLAIFFIAFSFVVDGQGYSPAPLSDQLWMLRLVRCCCCDLLSAALR